MLITHGNSPDLPRNAMHNGRCPTCKFLMNPWMYAPCTQQTHLKVIYSNYFSHLRQTSISPVYTSKIKVLGIKQSNKCWIYGAFLRHANSTFSENPKDLASERAQVSLQHARQALEVRFKRRCTLLSHTKDERF